MITIRQLTADPARDIVEGRTKLPTVRTVPMRDGRLKPLNGGASVLASRTDDRRMAKNIDDVKNTINFAIKHGLANRGFQPPPPNPANRLPMPEFRAQQLTVRFKELLEDFMALHPEPFTNKDLDAWLMDRNVNYSSDTLVNYIGLAIKEGLVVVVAKTGNYHVNLYAAPDSRPASALAGDAQTEAGV